MKTFEDLKKELREQFPYEYIQFPEMEDQTGISIRVAVEGRLLCWRSWRQLREEEEQAIREAEEKLDRFIAFTRGAIPIESGDRFCMEVWGDADELEGLRHVCYLDKSHEGPHVCGLCEEGFHEVAS